ncbi:MAG: DUF1294 domain-containing protein [Tissierellia bacterium]|nr:DUF1294 domain-containing protein [Tissierellia bacterium]
MIYYYIFLNISTFFLYGWDKNMAKYHRERIPERILFIMSFLGGSLGGIFGMFLFRHKTKKKLFYVVNVLALLFHIWIWRFYLQGGKL